MENDPSASNENRLPLEKNVFQQFIEDWIASVPEELARAARYAALVHAFDPGLLGFLQDTEEETENLIARLQSDEVIVSVGPNRYSFEPSLRQPYLHIWQASDPEGYRRASGRAAEYYRSRQIESDIDRIEYVYHLLGADDALGLLALGQEVERMLAEYRLGLAERLLQYADEQMSVLRTSVQVWLRLFQAQLKLAHYHYEQSEKTFRTLLTSEVEPSLRAEALMCLASVLAATQRWNEAIKSLDEARRIFLQLEDRFKAALALKAQGEAYLHLVSNLGGLHQDVKIHRSGYELWFRRIALFPFLVYRWLSRRIELIPNLYFGTDYQDWVIFNLINKAIRNFEQASRQLARIPEGRSSRRNDIMTDLQIYLADLYHRVGRWTKAARLFEGLVTATPIQASDYRRATLQLARGRAALAQSSLNTAREFLLDARQVFAQYADHRALAATTRLLGDTEVVANKPNDSVPFYAESVEASLTVDDLLESTNTGSAVRRLPEHFSLSPDARSRIDALTQKLDRRAYLIRFRSVLLERFRNLAARLAANVVLPLVYLIMSVVGIPVVRPVVIAMTTKLTCFVMPGCDTFIGDLVGSVFAILVPILVAVWAYEFFYLFLGWQSVRRLPLDDIAQFQSEFVVIFPTGMTLRDEAGQLSELPWDNLESHTSANRAIWRVPIALFSRQFLIAREKLSIIDGVAHHYQSLRQDITEHLEQTKNRAVQHTFDYAFFTMPWTIIALLLVTGMTTISIRDVFDQSLCRKPNVISLNLQQELFDLDQFRDNNPKRYVYVSTDDGNLHILSVQRDPNEPDIVQTVEVSLHTTLGQALSVVVKENYIYIADGTEGLRIIDVRNPADPSEVGSQDTPGQATDVSVKDNIAYIADGTEGLRIINVRNPANPSEVGSQDTPGQAKAVDVVGQYAYIADGTEGLRIIDVRNPANPSEVGSQDTPGQATDVSVKDNIAYIADGTEGLRIIDVRNPANPFEVGSQDTPGQATDVSVKDNIAYIADGTQGLRVMYLRNLSATQVVTTEEAATSVVMMLNFAFIADGNEGLLFVDVLNPCDQKSKLNDRKKNYVPVKGLINSMAVQEEIKRPIGSISSEFFFWALLFFPIIGLARLLYNRASLRRVDPQFVLGSDRPFWLGLLLLGALAVFHIWTLTW